MLHTTYRYFRLYFILFTKTKKITVFAVTTRWILTIRHCHSHFLFRSRSRSHSHSCGFSNFVISASSISTSTLPAWTPPFDSATFGKESSARRNRQFDEWIHWRMDNASLTCLLSFHYDFALAFLWDGTTQYELRYALFYLLSSASCMYSTFTYLLRYSVL